MDTSRLSCPDFPSAGLSRPRAVLLPQSIAASDAKGLRRRSKLHPRIMRRERELLARHSAKFLCASRTACSTLVMHRWCDNADRDGKSVVRVDVATPDAMTRGEDASEGGALNKTSLKG